MPNRRLLAIFAHPDDETFLAGSLLARYAATGVHVGLVWGGGRLEHDVVVGWVGLPARPHMRLARGHGAGNCACAVRRSRLVITRVITKLLVDSLVDAVAGRRPLPPPSRWPTSGNAGAPGWQVVTGLDGPGPPRT
ncbi:MAG: PIG-L family deacetylase [Chloroflexi bacterium]|nr:PIG-L family deacetylase [Chloroflexota bacterium]